MSLLDRFRKQPPTEEPRAAERAASPAPPEPLVIAEVDAAEVYRRMQAGENVVLLDVRMGWDHAALRPAGAQSLPLSDLMARLGELDPSQPYVLSCYHGISSLQGVGFLMEQGFTKVESLRGGFSGWAAAGLPVERG